MSNYGCVSYRHTKEELIIWFPKGTYGVIYQTNYLEGLNVKAKIKEIEYLQKQNMIKWSKPK